MKKIVKRVLESLAPKWTSAFVSAKSRAHSHRIVVEWGCLPVHKKLLERFGSSVQAGPFKGLVLTPMTHAEQIGPYLLGVYESELDETWATVFRGSYTQIIDVGAKFGFYAVGLARKYPQAEAIAFDTDWWARKAVREMAAANQTPNVKVEGFCTPRWLAQNTREGAFIISDCEGFESVLFNETVIPKMETATLIIETHDFTVPGVCERLQNAFGQTHVVQNIGLGDSRRTPEVDLSFLETERERELVTKEARLDQTWLLCLPRSGPNSSLQACAV